MSRADIALREMIATIPDLYAEISEMRVFGSYAHGTSSIRSDIDILILTEQEISDRVRRGKIREDIDDILSKHRLDSDVVFYTHSVYESDESRFTNELKRSKVIYERK